MFNMKTFLSTFKNLEKTEQVKKFRPREMTDFNISRTGILREKQV